MFHFVGRSSDLLRLEALWRKRTSSLVTCRGRRRIGKSTLIEEFARRTADHLISLDGQAPGAGVDNALQLRSFVEQLSAQTSAPNVKVETWLQAFRLLDCALPQEGRTVVLLDEISWMGGYDKGFPGTLKIMWDKYFRKHDNLVMVLCGSVSSWIADNILKGTGFAGRDSLDLVLEELPIGEAVSFWGEAGERVSFAEKLDFLSVTGGVPKYLEELDPGLTADENIRNLCFTPGGLLFRDFEQIFSKMFGSKYEDRKKILKAVMYGSRSPAEIAEALGKERNGHLLEHLEDLVLAGFLAKEENVNPKNGTIGRIARYRLKDNYLRFYLHHIEPMFNQIQAGNFQYPGLSSLKGWETVLGLQFENLVVNNYRSLLPILGIDGATILSAAPFRRAKIGSSRGVQVDLLIQTANSAYLVEIKRRQHIGKDVVAEIEEKVRRLGFSSSLRTALVYEGDLEPTIRTDRQLDFIIPAARLA